MAYFFETEISSLKKIRCALKNIYGLGNTSINTICYSLGITKKTRFCDLTEVKLKQLSQFINSSSIVLTSDLKKVKNQQTKSLISLKCQKGLRKLRGLPVRGQRTHTNSKSARKKFIYIFMKSTIKLRKPVFETFSKDFNSGKTNSSFMASFVTKTLRWNNNYVLSFIDNHIIHYPSPINLSYAWSFGSSAGICLGIQIFSGIFLAMHYTPHIDLAFSSVEHIMRDVNNGWLIRYIHANGASMFFIVTYCHIFRGLYYGSYIHPRQLLWCSGVIILILMMGTAFMGYVLPWGQMSFWGATVITSLVTAVPIVGQSIVDWLWGGFTVNNATLNRFFSLHFVLPFVIVGLVILHLALLHKDGSNNPLGVDSGIDKIPFYPYFVLKDLFAFFCFLLFFSIFVFYFPNTLGHPDNYIPADPMQTPAHIVPEWYFLPYYAILRSIPDKLGGVVAMVGSLLVFFLIPFTNTSEVRSTTFRPIFKVFYWLLVTDFIILGWAGQKPVKDTYVLVGQIATAYYFLFFIVLIPIIGILETRLAHHKL